MMLLPTSGNSPLTTVAQYSESSRPQLPTGTNNTSAQRPQLPTGSINEASPLSRMLPTTQAPRPSVPGYSSTPAPSSGASPYSWSTPAELKQRLYDLAHPAPPPPPVPTVPDAPLIIDFMDPNFDWNAYLTNNLINFGGFGW